MVSRLKRFTNDPEFVDAFRDFIQTKIDQAYTTMMTATEPHILYRLQGNITAYKRLLNIREEINTTDK